VQWKRELLTVGKSRKVSFFSGNLLKQTIVVSTFTGVLISQTASVNFTPGFKAEHFRFERVPYLLSSDPNSVADQSICLPMSLSLTIGYVDCLDLSSKECESMLSAGSLLAVINTHLNSEACWVGNYGLTKINIKLVAGQQMGIIKMEDCEEHPAIGISGIEQKVRVSLGDIHLSYGDLMALRQGQTLQITGLPFPYVKLYSADRCIATGELVNCNDQLYVQIAGLTSEGSNENL
jgi:flagellar motor switch/type III secretory pathway protein FliN